MIERANSDVGALTRKGDGNSLGGMGRLTEAPF